MKNHVGAGSLNYPLLSLLRRSIGRGFTLIELLVVVVFISILGVVLIPALLSRLSSTEAAAMDEAVPIRQAPPGAVAADGPGGRAGRPPRFESSTIELDVTASHVLDGFRVFTRYEADFSGIFVVRNVDPVVDTITLTFPFPPGINEAHSVSLLVRDATGTWSDEGQVRFGLDGMEWTGHVEPGETITAVVSYTAQGRDALIYDVVGSGRSGSVSVDLRLHNAPRAVVPPGALQPSAREGSLLSWRFDSLITSKPIVVELPAGTSPLGRVILVLQLAGVAVLVFGGGFWYLSEGYAPGRLDAFRWGHFMLLALNYSLFFGIFAVLGYRGPAGVALPVATLVSIPLLLLHVARITDLRFALSRALPLALVTLSAVVGGVFLDQHRPLVFLAISVGLLVFITLTYGGWVADQRAHREAMERQRKRSAHWAALQEAVHLLSALVQEHDQGCFHARRVLEEAPEGFEAGRAEIVRYQTLVEKALAKARDLISATTGLGEVGEGEGPPDFEHWIARISRCNGLLDGRGGSMASAVKSLDAEVLESRDDLRRRYSELARVVGEATALEAEVVGLREETDDAADPSGLERATANLAQARQEGEQAVKGRSDAEGDIRQRVSRAAQQATSISRHVSLVKAAAEAVQASARQRDERERREASGVGPTHCLACGEGLEHDSLFCANCGTPRPLDLACPACGLTTSLPRHMLSKGWKKRELHCATCGGALPITSGVAEGERVG